MRRIVGVPLCCEREGACRRRVSSENNRWRSVCILDNGHDINIELLALVLYFEITANYFSREQADWRFTLYGVDYSLLVVRMVTWR